MLRDELKKIQNKRKYCYKILRQYSDKMSQFGFNIEIDLNKSITYIDYLNMKQLKKEIDCLNNQGQKIVREILSLN